LLISFTPCSITSSARLHCTTNLSIVKYGPKCGVAAVRERIRPALAIVAIAVTLR